MYEWTNVLHIDAPLWCCRSVPPVHSLPCCSTSSCWPSHDETATVSSLPGCVWPYRARMESLDREKTWKCIISTCSNLIICNRDVLPFYICRYFISCYLLHSFMKYLCNVFSKSNASVINKTSMKIYNIHRYGNLGQYTVMIISVSISDVAFLLTSGTWGSRVNNLGRVGANWAQAGGGGARLQNKIYCKNFFKK